MNHTAMTSQKLKMMSSDVCTAALAFDAFQALRSLEVEEVWVLALGPSLKIIDVKMIFRGSVSTCMIHPREIFRFALMSNACNLIIGHNHPSQEPHPSVADIEITKQLVLVGKLIEIPILDHLIITRGGYVSLRAKAWCDF